MLVRAQTDRQASCVQLIHTESLVVYVQAKSNNRLETFSDAYIDTFLTIHAQQHKYVSDTKVCPANRLLNKVVPATSLLNHSQQVLIMEQERERESI